MRPIKTMGIVVVVLALLMAIGAMLPYSRATADSGGIIRPVKVQTLLAGAQSFLATDPVSTFVSAPMYVGDYGAVQFQVSAVLTDDEVLGPIAVYWTPQFSIEPLGSTSCAGAADWFDATSYQMADNGTWDQTALRVATGGTTGVGFEATALGACARMKISIAEMGVVFTPTVYARAINRQ